MVRFKLMGQLHQHLVTLRSLDFNPGPVLYYTGTWTILYRDLDYTIQGPGLYYTVSWTILYSELDYTIQGAGLYYPGTWNILFRDLDYTIQ